MSEPRVGVEGSPKLLWWGLQVCMEPLNCAVVSGLHPVTGGEPVGHSVVEVAYSGNVEDGNS